MSRRVLLVDDEPNVLQGYKRQLRKRYDLELAVGGRQALEVIESNGPFAVVVSDMQMPEISGVDLLSRIRELDERIVRIMLTGNADQKTAVDAVNEGNIFRFLNKPCQPEQLAAALDAGLEQYRLVTAEADLLNNTLSGSVRMLTQVLSLAMPKAFGMTQEARRLTRDLAEQIGVGPIWQVEMAAMLMRVGCVSLPADLLQKYLSADELTEGEQELVAQTPAVGHQLIAEIPRLEQVAELIRRQNDPPSGDTPIVSRILKVVGDYQRFAATRAPSKAVELLLSHPAYDHDVTAKLAGLDSMQAELLSVDVHELKVGMILEDHVVDLSGRILIAAGNEVHDAMLQKLQMVRRSATGVREPIQVRVVAHHELTGAER